MPGGDPPSSLIRFMHHRDGGERGNLYWQRANMDGAPFRGHEPPRLPEEEYQQRVVEVIDPKIGTFDLSDPGERQAYLEVLNKIVNGWATLSHRERRYCEGTRNWVVHIEWLEHFMEDGSPVQGSLSPSVMQGGNGHE